MAKLLYDYWFVQFDFPMTAEQATSLGQPELEGNPSRTLLLRVNLFFLCGLTKNQS